MKKLDSPLDREFENIMDEQLETLPYDFSQSFIDGFRLGAKMMLEIYMDDIQNSTCDKYLGQIFLAIYILLCYF